jgi:hypothetical protein
MFSKRWLYLFIPAVLVIMLVFTIQGAVATTAVTRPIPNTGAALDRAHAAEAARLSGQAREAERSLRVQKADAARWNAMAEKYGKPQTVDSARTERSLAAEAARWTALAQYYANR